MNYDALRTFVTVVEERNFTKAAEKLILSQPTVSLHIKQLEVELQTHLLSRSPKHVQITPTGQILYQRAKQIIQLWEKTKEEMGDYLHTLRGFLKIGASLTIGEYILPMILTSYHEQYPYVQLEVVVGNTQEVVQQVRSHQLDLGLIEGHTQEREVKVSPFMEDEMVFVVGASHPLAQQKPNVSLESLQNQVWIAREKGSGTREYMDHLIRKWGLQLKDILMISSNQGVKELVSRGIGVTCISRWVVQKEVDRGEMVMLSVFEQPIVRTLSYVLPMQTDLSRSGQVFLECLIDKSKI
ncbi:selenium metabolism-associated LysR family transcriptional regulator [Thermoflavimicrobium daqui]|uniref:LysR family transcriptional regulator n=1 Tax=Thermoflavimicrobium daqui TaxID=2137476 RepID=A0A364K213_9BACL|nr:selenium metabolism-associated LysR family transcriptional regulator [Thermoflavimicrobium daqui]RAL22066.1 LysR family transcriptional regulator [Thermoflavimicrobium daqui]